MPREHFHVTRVEARVSGRDASKTVDIGAAVFSLRTWKLCTRDWFAVCQRFVNTGGCRRGCPVKRA